MLTSFLTALVRHLTSLEWKDSDGQTRESHTDIARVRCDQQSRTCHRSGRAANLGGSGVRGERKRSAGHINRGAL